VNRIVLKPTCLVFSHREDEHLAAVLRLIPGEDVPFVVDTRDFGSSFAATVDIREAVESYLRLRSGEVVSLCSLKSIWWRRPAGVLLDPGIPKQMRAFVENERTLFIAGLLASVPPWVRQYNSPSSQQRIDSKLYQIQLAKSVGLRVPNTCVTSDPSAARAFLMQSERCIFKSFWGTHEFWQPTRLLTPELATHLDHLVACPSILQDYIDGEFEIRATVIDEDIHAAAFDLRHSRYPADVRIDTRLPCRPFDLPDGIGDGLKRLMKAAEIRYGAFDLRLTKDGDFVFLEVNPAGQFLYIDIQAGTRIVETMARALCRDVVDHPNLARTELNRICDGSPLPSIEPLPFAAIGPDIRHLP